MTRDEFWKLIDDARAESDNPWETAANVQFRLSQLPADVIFSYLEHQDSLMSGSYSWKLWGAAYLANGGCSDDGFEYFRAWLLTQGREAFERIVEDPDALVELVEEMDEAECEDMMGAPIMAYQAVTGDYPKGRAVRYPDLGEGWDFDEADEMRKRYPRLFERFGW